MGIRQLLNPANLRSEADRLKPIKDVLAGAQAPAPAPLMSMGQPAQTSSRQDAIRALASQAPELTDDEKYGAGVVESGQISQEDFDKARNPGMDSGVTSAIGDLAGGLSGGGEAPAPIKQTWSTFNPEDAMAARRAALMAAIKGQ